jgi:hypothetical protein
MNVVTPRQAWLNLAADVLLLAISDVRQIRSPEKREWAKAGLKSPAAALFLDEIINPHFDVVQWVDVDCPILDN